MLEPFHSGHIIVYCCAVFGLLQVHCPVVNVKEQAVLACDWWIGIPGEHPCCSCLRARLFTMLGKCLVCFCNLNKVLWWQSFYWSSRGPNNSEDKKPPQHCTFQSTVFAVDRSMSLLFTVVCRRGRTKYSLHCEFIPGLQNHLRKKSQCI